MDIFIHLDFLCDGWDMGPMAFHSRVDVVIIHSFNKYLLNICSDQCPKLDSEDTVMNKIDI